MKRCLLLIAILAEGCSVDTAGTQVVTDASAADTSTLDARRIDSPTSDAEGSMTDATLDGAHDASPEDDGALDASDSALDASDSALDASDSALDASDAEPVDASPTDGNSLDSSPLDASDAGANDANELDVTVDSATDSAVDASVDAAVDSSPIDASPDAGDLDSSVDASDGADAGFDFSCVGSALPTTAPATITLAGITTDPSGAPVQGVSVAADDAVGTPLGTATSDATGAFSMSVVTGGSPLQGLLKATFAGDETTYLFPPVPLAGDQTNLVVPMATALNIGLFALAAGQSQSSADGFLGVEVIDCANHPVSGATISVSAGSLVYLANGKPSAGQTSTDSSGTAFVFNVRPGNITVGAQVGGMTLRTHAVRSFAGAVTETLVSP